MSFADLGFIDGFIRMADDGYKKGWHERNGGNLSYRMKPDEIDEARWYFGKPGPWVELGSCVPDLAGEFFLVTGTGKFFRNIKRNPKENIGICEIDGEGWQYRVMWGLEGTDNKGAPTSEFMSHLMNHTAKISAKGGKYRVIYHCHTTNVIALTYLLALDEKIFTRELWEMITECALVFPDGVGVMPWAVPGSLDIAAKSAALMKMYDVIIWAHHGIFCAGEDFDLTFGLAETVEKAAEILLKIMSASPDRLQNKLQTITNGNLKDLANAFSVVLPEKFI